MSHMSLGTPVCAQALPAPITVPAYAIEACRLLVNMCFDMSCCIHNVTRCNTQSVSQTASRPSGRALAPLALDATAAGAAATDPRRRRRDRAAASMRRATD